MKKYKGPYAIVYTELMFLIKTCKCWDETQQVSQVRLQLGHQENKNYTGTWKLPATVNQLILRL